MEIASKIQSCGKTIEEGALGQLEHLDNTQLRKANEMLRVENIRYKEALGKPTCPDCDEEIAFNKQQLRTENDRLREEIARLSRMVANHFGKPTHTDTDLSRNGPPRSLDIPAANFPPQGVVGDAHGSQDFFCSIAELTEAEKPVIIELAITAMEELIRMAQIGKPLWVSTLDNSSHETLNEDEYHRSFPRCIGPKPMGMKSEASRASTVVMADDMALVESLMNVNQWSNVFCDIVSRAKTLEVLSAGMTGNYNGSMQLMAAEYQIPSPLVPTRKSYFVRYCKQHTDGIWVVVDVSLDHLHSSSIPRCRLRPSGCIIQELSNISSKITWVEHVEVDNEDVHDIYKVLLNSGLAFGAKRWLGALDRQCERLASIMVDNILARDVEGITTTEGRISMLKLAERMVLSFCNGVGASSVHTWTTLSGSGGSVAEDVRVMTRTGLDDQGRPTGTVLSAATSFGLPVPPKQFFHFLRNKNARIEWDIASYCGMVQEMAHIANGRDPGNHVSLLHVTDAKSSQENMFILQESLSVSTGSYVIYSPVEIVAMNGVLSGGNPDYVALLPSGFAILPDGSGQYNEGVLDSGTGGSLITIAFQILVDSVSTPKLPSGSVVPIAELPSGSVATLTSLVMCTIARIKAAAVSHNMSTANWIFSNRIEDVNNTP